MAATLDTIFAALSDATRRDILGMLLEDDMAVTDIAEPFDMSLAAISKHLAILTRAGLISRERRGRIKWCRLEPDAMRDASIWMQGFGQFAVADLEAFETFIEQEFSSTPDPGDGPLPSPRADDERQTKSGGKSHNFGNPVQPGPEKQTEDESDRQQ